MAAIFYVFHDAERYHRKLEGALSSYFKQNVSIKDISTSWESYQPTLSVQGFKVDDAETGENYASVKSLTVRLDLFSILYLWPKFDVFSVDEAIIYFESLDEGRFKVAGKSYIPTPSRQKVSKLLFAWVSSQKNMTVNGSQFIWNHREGKQTRIKDITAEYKGVGSQRELSLLANQAGQNVSLFLAVNGNAFLSNDWDGHLNFVAKEAGRVGGTPFKIEGLINDGSGSIVSHHIRSQRLVDLVNIFGRGQFLNKWLSASDMQGDLSDVEITFRGALYDLDTWQIKARANELGWRSVYGLPGLDDSSVVFRINQSEGTAAFLSEDSTFDWPKLFLRPIGLDKMAGEFSFLKTNDKWSWKLHKGELENKDLRVNDLNFDLTGPAKSKKKLNLKAAVFSQDIQKLKRYFPKKTSSGFQSWWSNAIGQDISVEGNVAYTGLIDNSAIKNGEANLLVDLNAKNIALDYGYKRNWPVLKTEKMKLVLDKQNLSFTTEKANFNDVLGTNVVIDIPRIFHDARIMKFKSRLSGKSASLIRFLQEGPLVRNRSTQQGLFSSSEGFFEGKVEAAIPLYKGGEALVGGDFNLDDTQLSIGPKLTANSISGNVQFTHDSVTANDLTGRLFNSDVKANIVTVKRGKPPALNINLQGNSDVTELDEIVGPQLTSRLQGKTDWLANVFVSDDGVDLSVTSDLTGITVDLPEPLAKAPTESKQLKVVLKDGKNIPKSLVVSASNDLYVSLKSLSIQGGDLLDQGVIVVGENTNNIKLNDGVRILVNTESSDVDAWLDAVSDMSKIKSEQKSSVSFIDQLRRIDIGSRKLSFLNKSFGKTIANLSSDNGKDWQIQFDSENVKGQGELQPFAKTQQYSLDLDRLYWPLENAKPEENGESTSTPESFPRLNLTAKDFRVKGQKFGTLTLNAYPQVDAWEIEKVNISGENHSIGAQGRWKDDQTQIALKIKMASGGQSFNDLDNFLVAGEGLLTADLNWQGSPAKFDSSGMKGDYDLTIKDGNFPKVNADKGRIFGLLNINTLSRRLRLDFEDVFDEGLSFDKLEATGSISNGNIHIGEFYIYAPSVFVESQGKVNFKDETYDLELKVSPQLGGNLALLAALSNPAAGAAVWVIDKLFKGKLNQVVVYSYDVKGPWNSPLINRNSNQKQAESTD